MRRCAIGLIALLIVACGEAAPSSDDWGLAGLDPAGISMDDAAAILDAMPAELEGHPRVESGPGERQVEYDSGPFLGVVPVEGLGAEGEEPSPAAFLRLMADSGAYDVVGSALDGETVWLHCTTARRDGGTEHFLVWADADGDFVLWFGAQSENDLAALVGAFVEQAAT